MAMTPKGEQALKLLIELNELNVQEYQKILNERVGPEVLAVFEGYCRELVPEDQGEEVLGTLLHLMITGYLVSANEEKSLMSKIIQVEE